MWGMFMAGDTERRASEVEQTRHISVESTPGRFRIYFTYL